MTFRLQPSIANFLLLFDLFQNFFDNDALLSCYCMSFCAACRKNMNLPIRLLVKARD